jgi:hypothetical protein
MKRIASWVAFVGLVAGTAAAQGRSPKPPPPPERRCPDNDRSPKCVRTIDIGPMQVNGVDHRAQLLYFLERADEELQRASLERKSFIPRLVLTVDEEAL